MSAEGLYYWGEGGVLGGLRVVLLAGLGWGLWVDGVLGNLAGRSPRRLMCAWSILDVWDEGHVTARY